jgi:hypothetical protein
MVAIVVLCGAVCLVAFVGVHLCALVTCAAAQAPMGMLAPLLSGTAIFVLVNAPRDLHGPDEVKNGALILYAGSGLLALACALSLVIRARAVDGEREREARLRRASTALILLACAQVTCAIALWILAMLAVQAWNDFP